MDESSWEGWSSKEWADWVSAQIKRKEYHYKDVDYIVKEYREEKNYAKDYAGRVILELIQNADDAGVGFGKPNKVLIKLTKEGLIIANTGVPFRPRGLKSVMISHLTGKSRQKTIGYKGLGFRSVLNWASEIAISSGKLSVSFNEAKALKWLEEFRKNNPRQNADLKILEEEADILNPIATLSVPEIISDKERPISIPGYDTLIHLKFKRKNTWKTVQKQIQELSPEVLLFLNHLHEMKIISQKLKEDWKVVRKHRHVEIGTNESKQIWRVLTKKGKVPSSKVEESNVDDANYQIKLAYLDGTLPNKEAYARRKLFTYFSTSALFPFPVHAHVTFDISNDRKTLREHSANAHIAQRLASLMANLGEKLSTPSHPWRGLKTVSPAGTIDPTLLDLGFEQALQREIKDCKIIPVREHKFLRPGKALRIRGNFDTLLTGRLFKDLTIHTDNGYIKGILDELRVQQISSFELKWRLDRYSKKLTHIKRALVIRQLIRGNLIVSPHVPNLLIDENRKCLSSNKKAFLPPKGDIIALPTWMPRRIVNKRLVNILVDKFGCENTNELVRHLQVFNIQKYDTGSLLSAILSEAKSRIQKNQKKETQIRREAIRAVWKVYCSVGKTSAFPSAQTIFLPNRKGNFVEAKSLYLGKEYQRGILTEYLYGSLFPELIVARPEELGIKSQTGDIESFLLWLSVEERPREVRVRLRNADFKDFVIEGFNYPVKAWFASEYKADTSSELRKCHPELRYVLTLDKFKVMLEKADPHAIIAWVCLYRQYVVQGIDEEARMEICPKSKQLEQPVNNQRIPSYVQWLLRTRSWLPLPNGRTISPSRCVLHRSVHRELARFISRPEFNKNHELFTKFDIDEQNIKSVLVELGVPSNLSELPWEEFYAILLEHHKIDPKGKYARRLYTALANRKGDIARFDPDDETYRRFLNEGKLLGKKGTERKYYPVSELYYFENRASDYLSTDLPRLELNRREGSNKVKRIFGVKPFILPTVTLKKYQEHISSQVLQDQLTALKQYIYALRVLEDSDGSDARILNRITVKLCTKVIGEYTLDGKTVEFSLKEGYCQPVEDTLYIVGKATQYKDPIRDTQISSSLADALADKLKVEAGDRIVRVLRCHQQSLDTEVLLITGDDEPQRLDKARELLASVPKRDVLDTGLVSKKPKSPLAPQPIPSSKSQPGGVTPTPPKPSGPPGPVITLPLGPITPIKRRKVKLKIQKKKSTTSKKPGARSNEDYSEKIAFEFENERKRFPRLVGHIQGSEAYGCDIISFKSKKDFDEFEKSRDLALVERFIEVKGRSSKTAPIHLEGYQLERARESPDKFFLYRLYKTNQKGIYELYELHNPLSHVGGPGVLQQTYTVDPFVTDQTNRYRIIDPSKVGKK